MNHRPISFSSLLFFSRVKKISLSENFHFLNPDKAQFRALPFSLVRVSHIFLHNIFFNAPDAYAQTHTAAASTVEMRHMDGLLC